MKEICWEAVIAGKTRHITCVTSGNKYVIYVDDEHLTNVYRERFRQMIRYGMEKPIVIDGENCLLVVWDEKPDLVVRGKMLSRNESYAQARDNRKKQMCSVWKWVIWIGVGLLLCAIGFAVTGKLSSTNANEWLSALTAAIAMIVSGMLRRKKWREW